MAKIIFSEEAQEIYNSLEEQSKSSKQERMILDSLNTKLELIQKNPFYGDSIRKSRIPRYYKLKYSAKNLFRVELPQFWRMLYTMVNQESDIEIIAFVLEVDDHKGYNKRFGYK
jgi:plasmid maintenance system killer protein